MRNEQVRRTAIALIAVMAAITIAVALVAGCSPNRGAEDRPAPAAAVGVSYADLVERVSPHVVTVRTGGGVGSGVVFRPDVVLTNEHVVGDTKQVVIEYADGSRSGGTVLATDAITDLAVVRTERTGLPVAEFGRELPRPGDPVLAIGSPLGFENSVTDGIVSGLHRAIPGSATSTRSMVDLIQISAPISPGNSGGALFDTAGRVIGINEAYIPPSAGAVALGFAIPSATAADIAEQLLRDGTAVHPYLGLTVDRLTPRVRDQFGVQADHGLLVFGVDPDGPAAAAGIQPGDVVTRFQDAEVRAVEDLLGALRRSEPGRQVTVTVVRDGQTKELKATIAARTR
ncbi:serine protease, S1-C subfamily, contains C-terminal PDZ domain [Lentzea albidocapillata subsp. violacea]|uniref:Serine protease, S1-C subfamily, contains C-terminal PDZ domain n=1 Tax=Lentzea albidocapillata subsp. violacea TaxID=128104 RepID=A0A1G8YP96_9PSEU|nr:trypsin-like peptidase domain-containing protein [Lentzea albidocapillata]SDK04608.1 serine protease, S1-C subfamily, contains C-terminal PDZ domain [Lentzea albidocapillata subsp. violacea]